MINTKQVSTIVNEIYSVTCDRCEKEINWLDNPIEAQEFHHIDFRGGYASVFGDEAHIQCDLCQHCLHALIKDFYREVSPITTTTPD